MTNLITEARELSAIDIENQPIHAVVIIDELCDALEKAAKKNDELIRELSQLARESVKRDMALARLEAEVMAARDSMCWIPVTERLPPTEKPVQVYMPKLHMSVQTGFYTKYYGEDDGEWYEHWVASSDVTHWREIPAPPEEGTEL
jgi:hypothetical protein